MTSADPTARFSPPAMALHWLVAVCVAMAVALALYLDTLDVGETKTLLLTLHKSLGLSILLVMLARLGVRLMRGAPPLAMPLVQRLAAGVTHTLLYALMLAMPVTGYISVASRGRETTFFGLFTVPRVTPLDRAWSQWGERVHDLGQYALYALVAAHVGAVLYHELIARDRLLSRMWPARWENMLVALRRAGRVS